MSYTVSDDAEWLSVSPVSGTSTGETDTITISYDTASLMGGSYTGLITVAAADADNTPQDVVVVLTVIPPNITLSTSQLSVSVMTGQDPSDQTFTVRNAGNTSAMSYTVSDDVDWLSVSPASGVSTGETDTVTVYYNTASMAGGSYTGWVTVASTAAENSPETIEVLLTLIPSTIYVSAEAGSDANSGFSWNDAKATIQAGVDTLAVSGGMVLVSNGVYGLTGEINVNKALTIESVNGPDVTVVDARRYGRCFNLSNPDVVLSGLTCTNGYSESNGGGIYCSSSFAVITNCVVSGCIALGSGGGVRYGKIYDSIISGNSTDGYGGGADSSILYKCEVLSNSAIHSGGGIFGGSAENCLIINNRQTDVSGYGGGGACSATVRNCTICDNYAGEDGGGAIGTTIYNSIIYYNVASSSGDNTYNSTEYGSCGTDLGSGNGNISSAPQFANQAADDYRLASGSPCVDAGINLYVTSMDDLDGNVRIQNTIVDMGAYEYVPGSTSGPVSTVYISTETGSDTNSGASWADAKKTIQAGVDSVVSGGTVLISNGVYNLTDEIIVNKPLTLQSVNGPEVTIIDAQWYSRCLTISSDSVSVEGFTLRNGFADEGDGGAVYGSYDSDASLINCVISDNISWNSGGGVYLESTWRSRGRLEDCIFLDNQSFFGDGGGAVADSATNCLFERNIAHGSGGGLYAGRASDSTFRDNTAEWDGGGLVSGLAFRCRFEGNSAQNNGGGMYSGTASGCLFVSNSAFFYGGGAYDCAITNCTVVANQAGHSGGGMHMGRIRNSIVYYNTPDDLFDVSSVLYSCSPSLTDGLLGNITNSPAFIDRDLGNYRLSAESLCIDAGINAYAGSLVDLDGNPRIQNSRVDMGAFEYHGTLPDSDNDGLNDAQEIRLGTNQNNPDSDNDGFKDGWEVSQGWNPKRDDAAVCDYIGSNPSVFGYYTPESIGDLAMGEMMVGVNGSNVNVRLQMMQSSDLITWTNAGPSMEWSAPAIGKGFFRIRAQP
jgi:parallel beta-helix repeat protein